MDCIALATLETFSHDALTQSKNTKVRRVLERLDDKKFLDRVNSYSETYWDRSWSGDLCWKADW